MNPSLFLCCVVAAAGVFACSSTKEAVPLPVAADAGSTAAATGTDASAQDSATTVLFDAASSERKVCLDDGSNGPGVPFTCDVLPAGLSAQEISTACGAFKIQDSCPSEKRTYRCGNAKSFVAPSVRTERFYYLAVQPSSEKSVQNDCTAREGDYSAL